MQTTNWQYPRPLSFPSKTKHTATVILLHGLGDTASGWADFAPMLQMQMPHVKFVFPTAPTRPITLNGGMKMTGWLVDQSSCFNGSWLDLPSLMQ